MMNIKPILRDPNAEPAVSFCEKCGGEIYGNGVRFFFGGLHICTECFRLSVRNILWNNPEQIAQEMGVSIERIDEK